VGKFDDGIEVEHPALVPGSHELHGRHRALEMLPSSALRLDILWSAGEGKVRDKLVAAPQLGLWTLVLGPIRA